MEDHIKNIKSILVDFLKNNGGYGNGFETYVSGIVSQDVYSCLEWSTPQSEKLTGIEVRVKGRDLYNVVHKYLKENGIKETLVIKKEHIEHGCFDTTFYFQPKKERVSFI